MNDITRRTFALASAGAVLARGQSSDEDITGLTLIEAVAKIRSQALTSTRLTEACLARIAIYNPKLNAFITVLKEKALAQAREMDAETRAGKFRGPLHGIPVALKDNIDTAGIRTT